MNLHPIDGTGINNQVQTSSNTKVANAQGSSPRAKTMQFKDLDDPCSCFIPRCACEKHNDGFPSSFIHSGRFRYFSGPISETKELKRVLSHYNNLQNSLIELVIEHVYMHCTTFKGLVIALPNLKYLSINKCCLSNEFFNLIQSIKTLEKVEIKFPYLAYENKKHCKITGQTFVETANPQSSEKAKKMAKEFLEPINRPGIIRSAASNIEPISILLFSHNSGKK